MKCRPAANAKRRTMASKQNPDTMGSTIMALPSLRSLRGTNLVIERDDDGAHTASESTFKIRLANQPRIRDQASILINERYAQRGYGPQKVADERDRLTIVAYEGPTPVGTLSIGFDGPKGMLCDDLYKSEIDRLRSEGRQVCEFIKFAAHNPASSPLGTLAVLFHVAFLYASATRGYSDVVAEVNPRHVKFYKRGLGFQQIGPERVNSRVNAPAVLLCAQFDYIGEQIRRFAGSGISHMEEKSIYPYGFGPDDASGILQRLAELSNMKGK
jgi:hypothetical protein